MRVVVIGMGGVGSYLVPPLARYLDTLKGKETHCLILVDGDTYEPKNMVRQDIGEQDLGVNKAIAQMRRLEREFSSIEIRAIASFIDLQSAKALLEEEDIVMLCVDNFASRKMVQDVCVRMQSATILSGGNELTDGNVQVFVKKNGRQYTPQLHDYHPEIAQADDHPNSVSCAEAARDNEQIIFANLTVAALMLNSFYGLTKRVKPRYAEVYFDIEENSVVPVERKVISRTR